MNSEMVSAVLKTYTERYWLVNNMFILFPGFFFFKMNKAYQFANGQDALLRTVTLKKAVCGFH